MISVFRSDSNRFTRGLLQALPLLACLLPAGCATPPGPRSLPHSLQEEALIAPDAVITASDGAKLPVRLYRPSRAPRAVILALHGFGDSRDAWEIMAPSLTARGLLLVAPDQRGFGAAPREWADTRRRVQDVREELSWIRRRWPDIPLYLMGESMGAAVALLADTAPPSGLAGTILLAPAILTLGQPWQSLLGVLDELAPRWTLTEADMPGRRIASDNVPAMRRMYFDPLTRHASTVHALYGLTRLMGDAARAVPSAHLPLLVVIGGRDPFIPPQATTRLLRRLPAGTRLDELRGAHHLLSRDRRGLSEDLACWIFTPDRFLPSGGGIAASTRLTVTP